MTEHPEIEAMILRHALQALDCSVAIQAIQRANALIGSKSAHSDTAIQILAERANYHRTRAAELRAMMRAEETPEEARS
jgi:Ni,Fe-hydrogenase I large subunit